MTKKSNIVIDAIKTLEEKTRFKAKYNAKTGLIQLLRGKQKYELTPIIKQQITTTALTEILKEVDNNQIVVTQYIAPKTALRLKEKNIQFIDTAGNAHINKDMLFIFMLGQKPAFDNKPEKPTRLFRPAGVKTLFTLLSNPRIENKPLRLIAKDAHVALDTVAGIIRDMKEMGYLIKKGRCGRQVIQKEDLLRRWIDAYQEQLQPKLLLSSYQCDDITKMQKIDVRQFDALWGSEPAAAITTKYLKPGVLTLYTDKINPHLLFNHRLKKQKHGNVIFMKKFWNFENEWTKQGIVPPILTYADLLITQSDRNRETAEILYDETIVKRII